MPVNDKDVTPKGIVVLPFVVNVALDVPLVADKITLLLVSVILLVVVPGTTATLNEVTPAGTVNVPDEVNNWSPPVDRPYSSQFIR